jgi:hypothetical protein
MADSMENLRDMMLLALVGLLFLLAVVCGWACYCRLFSYRGQRGFLDQTTKTTRGGGWVPFSVDDSAGISYETLKKKGGGEEPGGTQAGDGGSAFAPLG